jgi:thiamine pyrophosphate-dependent acetolactate synthase large subunit-like protein
MVGVDHDSGLFFPSFEKISLGFGIEYIEISELKYFREAYNVKRNGPRIFDVLVNPDQTISPMLKFGGSLKNLDASIQMPSFNF